MRANVTPSLHAQHRPILIPSSYYMMVLEHERTKQPRAGVPPLFHDVLRLRELSSGVTLDVDVCESWSVAQLKERLHEVLGVNRSCVSIMAGCDVLQDNVLLQVMCDV